MAAPRKRSSALSGRASGQLAAYPSLAERVREYGKEVPPLDEWVESRRIIVGGARPGPWDPRNARASVEPMRAFSDRSVRRITIVAPTQLMKSEYAVNVAVYDAFHGHDVLFYEPAEDLLRAFVGDRIRPALRVLGGSEYVGGAEALAVKKRDSAIAIRFRGGGLITGLTPSLRTARAGRTARTVVLDERDLMGSADMEQIALSRTTTYGRDAKIVALGTPTEDEPGTIWRLWAEGSRGEWRGLCPKCGTLSRVRWAQVAIERGPKREWLADGARLACSECGSDWTERERLRALDRGAYVHERPDSEHRSYWVPGPAHLWRSVESIVAAGWTAYSMGLEAHDWTAYRRWVNEFRAEPWEDEFRGLSSRKLGEGRWDAGARGEGDWGELDPDVLLVTWGADVQATAVHCEWVAWGWDAESERVRSWGLRYAVIGGTPEDSIDDGEVWAAVRDALAATRFRMAGRDTLVGPQKGLIDCRWHTPRVRGWCEEMAREERLRGQIPARKWGNFAPTVLPYMSKAVEAGHLIDLRSGVSSVEKRRRVPAIVYANSTTLKSEQFESFQLDQRSERPANLLPSDAESRGYDDAWRGEIAAEVPVVVRSKRGAIAQDWERKRGQGRNEAWDCRIYARAAAHLLARGRPLAEYLARLHSLGRDAGKIVPFPGGGQ